MPVASCHTANAATIVDPVVSGGGSTAWPGTTAWHGHGAMVGGGELEVDAEGECELGEAS